jgi:TolB-like protein
MISETQGHTGGVSVYRIYIPALQTNLISAALFIVFTVFLYDMADIFISYSSKDRAQAELLTELLTSAGLSVWIDQQGIGAATSWSAEIYDAIDTCKALIVMLSPDSIISKNVAREVALAFEKNKKILPLDLEPVELTRDLGYHLAGLQRTPMTNIDAIIRALGKLGLEATKAPEFKLVKESDGRKSLMILPFEDLSPTADNQWFTDGIVSELINALSNVKSLRVMDAQTTKEFKNYKGHLTIYAKEMGIRYFVQGDVRKFGDQIKISSRLLDIETGDHLWQDSLKGTMEDIFDIQETVAEKVVEGLKVHLAPEEKKKLSERGTENAEAYELYLKGIEYFSRQTKSDIERALTLFEETVRLDPQYSAVYRSIAITLAEIYRLYNRTPSLLDRADAAAERIREIEGESARYASVKSNNFIMRGDPKSALHYAQRSVEIDPNYASGYSALGFAYEALGDMAGRISAWKECVRLYENNRDGYFNLLVALNELPDTSENRQELREAAERALPVFERHIRLNPDDYHARVNYAGILYWADQRERAAAEADKLSLLDLDGFACFILACLYLKISGAAKGFAILRRSVEKGFQDIDLFRHTPYLDSLRGLPEFEELMKELEEKIAKEKND